MQLELEDAVSLNLTLYGRSSHSALHLHPPEEEDEETKDGEGQREAFYCCLPVRPPSEATDPNVCLLWMSNETVSNATAKEKLPWKRTKKGLLLPA